MLTTLAIGLFGIGRSLWLDEAWVANSALAPSLAESLWGGEWLQTSPLGFVLAARMAPESVVGLRSVSLIFALAAAGLLLSAARRVLTEPLAVLMTATVLFDPVAIEYLRSFKQFGVELAATAALLLVCRDKRFPLVVATVMVAMLFAYPSLLLVPGILWLLPRRQAVILGAIAAAEAGLLYWFMIRPNAAPILWDYWDTAASPQLLVLLAVVAGLFVFKRHPIVIVCITAIGLTFAFYPASPRTWLFLRPCIALPIALLLDRFRVAPIAYAAALLIAINGLATQIVDRTDQPFEAYAEVVAALKPRVRPNDLLLVHANAREGFRLHARLAGWDPPAVYGSTGWPCCRRVENTPRGSANRDDVERDLTRLMPAGFNGRVWLVFANRDLHWQYLGLDEGKVWRNTLWERGCPPGPYMDFGNLVLSPMHCAGYSP